jgi:N-acylneuraminate cytidylyltransferase
LAGKPLIAWTIAAAQGAAHLDRVILSTEDSHIAEVAARFGCEIPFRRPTELAGDGTPSADVVLHALATLDRSFDLVVLLQPTSPLRMAADIDGCLRRCVDRQAPACVSVTQAKIGPDWMFHLGAGDRLQPVLPHGAMPQRRQDLSPTYVPNGAVYVARIGWFRVQRSFYGPDTVAFEMPKDRSIDIDDAIDFRLAETLLAAG